jgi:hypothetical protein
MRKLQRLSARASPGKPFQVAVAGRREDSSEAACRARVMNFCFGEMELNSSLTTQNLNLVYIER